MVYFVAKISFINKLPTKAWYEQLLLFFLVTFFLILFLTFQEHSKLQTTIGKYLFQLKVTRTDGSTCNFFQLFLRNSMKIFTCIYLFMFFFDFINVNNILLIALFFLFQPMPSGMILWQFSEPNKAPIDSSITKSRRRLW